MSEASNVEGAPAVAVQRVIIPPPADTRPRIITATITVRVGSHRPEEIPRVAHIRRRELDEWIKRHWKDIENAVPSMFDDMTYDSTITVEESDDSAV